MQRICVVGAGGLAREVRWLIEEIDPDHQRFEFAGYLVSDRSNLGRYDSVDEIVGELDMLDDEARRPDALALGIGAPEPRYRIGKSLSERHPMIDWPPLVHPSVRFDSGSCSIGRGAVLCGGVIMTVNVEVGDFALLNLACTVGHEARIGAGTVLNPTVNISGGVVLQERVLVGTGAQVLQYLEVGNDSVVGAGAVVTKTLGQGVTAVGIPAKVIHVP